MQYLSDKQAVANKLGYTYVSEAYEKLYKLDYKPSEIGEMFGVTKYTICSCLKAMGIEQRKRGGRNNTKLTEDKAREILKADKPDSYYLEAFDITMTTIQSIRKRRTWKDVQVA